MESVTSMDMIKNVLGELEDAAIVIKQISKNLLDLIVKSVELIIDAYRSGRKIILMGNGGSAADAQHISAEFIGRFKLERSPLTAIALTTNTSILTSLSNDFGFENVFSRQLAAIGNKNDILIAITTSGNSPNILKAAELAKMKNIKVIGMTGMNGGKLKDIADILINVPSNNTQRIQEAHILIGHIICGLVEKNLFC